MATRRDFIKTGGAGMAGLVAQPARAAVPPPAGGYPVLTVAPLKTLGKGAMVTFAYPDPRSPAILMRLTEPALGGVGPNREIVAYSTLCTHKGCPVIFKPDKKLLICPCHFSTFDPARAGMLVIGQASESLPQIDLRIENGLVQAVGMTGLVYGRTTNVS